MRRIILFFVFLCCFCRSESGISAQSQPAVSSTQNGTTTKPGVLIELFTSEGCSSCPPADALLRQIDARRAAPDAELVVLGEHVDYWDGTGWRDRFSSRDYTERQQEYARRFSTSGPYTPEMVIDGSREFVGNNAKLLETALLEAVARRKATISISKAVVNGGELSIQIETSALPGGNKHADLYVAVADNADETQVGGGENGGKRLQHVAVARSLERVGKIGSEGTEKVFKVRLQKSENPTNLRVIAFLQQSNNGPVLGAAVRLLNADSTIP